MAGAYSIDWLQRALDLFANTFPMAYTVKAAPVTIPTSGTFTVPGDFILDMRNGVTVNASNVTTARRLIRRSYQVLLNRLTYSPGTGTPRNYSVLPPNVVVWPTPDQAYSGTLNYYAMPATLSAGDITPFPDGQILIDLVKLRAQEWARVIKAGSALEYARSEIAKIRASGLFNESENTEIPLDEEQFARMGGSPWSWMGPFSNQ